MRLRNKELTSLREARKVAERSVVRLETLEEAHRG